MSETRSVNQKKRKTRTADNGGDAKRADCPGIGHPRACPKCCGKGCKTSWIGDNWCLWIWWVILSFTGIVLYFITKFVFYPMWSLGQLPGVNPFGFTHLGGAPDFYAEWMPSLVLSGAFLLFLGSGILMIGGVHVPGFCFVLGTAALFVSGILDLYAGTSTSRFSTSMIVASNWLELSAWGVIFLGFMFAMATGLRPLADGVYGCAAYWGRRSARKSVDRLQTGGFGRPCGCCDGLKGCRSTWLGENTAMMYLFAFFFVLGLACYLLANVFYNMWAVGQFPLSDTSFSFTHQSWPSNSYLLNPFVAYMLIIGSGMLFVAALLLMIGGLHLPGIFWLLGTGALVSAHSMQYVYQTSGTGNVSNLETAMWVILAGYCSIIVGFFCTVFTGLVPRGMSGDVVKAARERISKSKPKPAEDISDDEDEETSSEL